MALWLPVEVCSRGRARPLRRWSEVLCRFITSRWRTRLVCLLRLVSFVSRVFPSFVSSSAAFHPAHRSVWACVRACAHACVCSCVCARACPLQQLMTEAEPAGTLMIGCCSPCVNITAAVLMMDTDAGFWEVDCTLKHDWSTCAITTNTLFSS